jgi:hypothetical protein
VARGSCQPHQKKTSKSLALTAAISQALRHTFEPFGWRRINFKDQGINIYFLSKCIIRRGLVDTAIKYSGSRVSNMNYNRDVGSPVASVDSLSSSVVGAIGGFGPACSFTRRASPWGSAPRTYNMRQNTIRYGTIA